MGTLADRIGTSYAREAIRPRNGGRMFRYRLHYGDGSEAGDAAYADNVNPGDELMLGPGKFVRVLDFVPVDEEGSPFVGLLKVEPL
jgi:hypothetical protein